MDKLSNEVIRETLIEIIKQFSSFDYVTDVIIRVPKSNSSEVVSSVADTLEKLSVLQNKTSTTRNSIGGDYDIVKARYYIDNNVY